MPSTKQLPQPWNSFLADLDQLAGEEVRLDCLGGFVVAERYGFGIPTAGIDVCFIAPVKRQKAILAAGRRGGPLHGKYNVYLNLVTAAQVPENYEGRTREMFPGVLPHLRLCALDPYDLALSKLARNRQRDRDDVLYLARTVPLDLSLLRYRYEQEMRWHLEDPKPTDQALQLWIEAIEETRLA